jgi:hypothetical protein
LLKVRRKILRIDDLFCQIVGFSRTELVRRNRCLFSSVRMTMYWDDATRPKASAGLVAARQARSPPATIGWVTERRLQGSDFQ